MSRFIDAPRGSFTRERERPALFDGFSGLFCSAGGRRDHRGHRTSDAKKGGLAAPPLSRCPPLAGSVGVLRAMG